MHDTSLIFQFIARGERRVQAAAASTAAAIVAANSATRRSNDRTVASHQRVSREVFKIDNVFRNTFRRWASVFALMGGLILTLTGHTVAFIGAVWQVLGVLAALPAVAFAAVAGLGSLFLIFKGLPAAMQKAGGGGASAADQIAAATRRYEMAQRAAADAQEDLNRAREDAARALANMDRELKKAALDERSATLAVREAQQRLREARSSGNRNDIEAARIAYEQAVISLDEIRERNVDLKKEEAERAAKGVEGSDEVQDALRRQADAMYELQQAQKALTQGSGGGGTAAEAYAKLSDAGKALVDTLKAQGPQWRVLQRDMQQAGLAGVADDVRDVSGVLLAQRGHLVGIAAAWNTAIRGVLGYFKSARGARDLNTSLGNTVVLSQHLGRSWQPFIHGIMQFVTVGSGFFPRLGAWIEKLANDFDRWATSAAESGKIADWIDKGAKAAADLGHWIRDISGGIGAIFNAGSGGPNYLSDLADDAERWRDAMNDPEMQARLIAFFAAAREAGSALWVVIKALTDAIIQQPDIIKTLAGALNIVGVVLRFAADNAGLLNAVLPPLITAFVIYKTAVMGARLAMMAWTVAVRAYTIAQWLLNAAMWANPIGLIIIAIIALIAVFVLLWIKCSWFRNFWIGLWELIKGAALAVGAWFAGPFVDFFKDAWQWIKDRATDAWQWIVGVWDGAVAFFRDLPGKITSAASGMWDGITNGAKAAINWLIDAWNKLDFGIHIALPWWAGGYHFDVNDIIPDIPRLATGGTIVNDGLAFVHAGERVVPAAEVRRGGGGGGTMRVELAGPAQTKALLKQLIREIVYNDGGGDVQIAFGR